MRRILVALDGSPESEQILEEVGRVGTRETALDLIHVLPPQAQEVPSAGVNVEDVAGTYLQGVAARIPDRKVRTYIWRGEPEEEIPRAARSLKADLIALTTHARKGLSHLLLGSVAEAVVRNSSTPVLLTRPGLNRPRKSLERILVPLDGTPESMEVAGTVRKLVADSGAEVILLQVVVPVLVADPVTWFTPIGVPQAPADPAPALEEFARQLARSGVRTQAKVVTGGAPEQILEQARAADADLIAMATAGRKGLSRFLRGSVAEDVLRHTDRAVLIHRIASKSEAATRAQQIHAQGAD